VQTEHGAIVAGSDFYYASLYLAPAERERVRVLEALRRAIGDVAGQTSDRGVAHVKLAWWQEEVERLAAGVPRHPLTQAAHALVAAHPRYLGVVARYVQATHAALAPRVATRRQDVLDAIAVRHGEFLAAYGGQAAQAPASVLEMGTLIEVAYHLRGLRQHRRDGLLYLAADELARHGLGVERVLEAVNSDALAPLLAAEFAWVEARLHELVLSLPRAIRRRERLAVSLSRMVLAAIELTRADGFHVLERRVEVTPVEKLWLAWRTSMFG